MWIFGFFFSSSGLGLDQFVVKRYDGKVRFGHLFAKEESSVKQL